MKTLKSTVPIIVDSTRLYEGYKMFRCTYLTVETYLSSQGKKVNLPGVKLPFLVMNLSGIITSPFKGDRFTSSKVIEDLINTVEKEGSLFVDINDIWFPGFLFNEDAARGDLYRVESTLFLNALDFHLNKIGIENYMSSCSNYINRISFSKIETKAFKKFESSMIAESRKRYEENKHLALEYK